MRAAALLLALALAASAAWARTPERVVSPGGTEAWLLADATLPVVSLSFRFDGGSASDPAGREGLTRFLVALLREGAGELDALAFRRRLDDRAIRLSFRAGRDGVSGNLTTLAENLDEAAGLLGDALARARFDAEAVERARERLEAARVGSDTRPGPVARREWFRLVFGDGPYGRTPLGTAESLAAIGADDLRAAARERFVRAGLVVGAAGDVDADSLGRALDLAFGDLPVGAPPAAPPETAAIDGRVRHVPMAVPQTELFFGLPGITRDDPDFFPAFVMNAILGGGAPETRLNLEVRERRGLTYSIYTYLSDGLRAPLLLGGSATRTDQAAETVRVVRDEIRRMATEGASDVELEEAKLYLTGSFDLSLDGVGELAGMLVAMQLHDLGIDYLLRRNGLVEAVGAEDVRRAAARLLAADRMVWVAVGAADPFGAPDP